MSDAQPELPPRRRAMQLVAERVVEDAPPPPQTPAAPTQPAIPPNLTREVMTRAAWRASVLGSINVIVAVLAIRLALVLSILGAFILAILSLAAQDFIRLAVLGTYVAGVVIPVVILYARRA